MSRGTKAPFKSYEGSKAKDKHVRLTKDMLDNKNFKNLKPNTKILYIYMKLWACGNNEFDYSISLGSNIISHATVISAIKELQAKGFIEKVRFSNGGGHIPNRYRLSDKWRYIK